jgi:hypothetical protein
VSLSQFLRDDPLAWLLEPEDPGVRYLVLRDVLDEDPDSRDLLAARQLAHREGPIAIILHEMDESGFWVEPGPGYSPKYRGTVWSVITLAQLGARIEADKRIRRAGSYLLENALADGGQFTASGTPSGTADCIQGNLAVSLLDIALDGACIEPAFDWMTRTVTGEGLSPPTDRRADRRYYSGKYGPIFRCGANNRLSCAWGAVKVMLALAALPPGRSVPEAEHAVEEGIRFLLGVDPATAEYPSGWSDKPSRNWWKFGFPVYYVTDLLQLVESLVGLGMAQDERLQGAVELIVSKQDEQGRWPLEYDYRGKNWLDVGEKGKPNKWVTLRALRVLKALT